MYVLKLTYNIKQIVFLIDKKKNCITAIQSMPNLILIDFLMSKMRENIIMKIYYNFWGIYTK